MDKTIGYYFERFIGLLVGIVTCFLVYRNWFDKSALLSEKYYDVIIKVSSSIFGFLLTILALIVNSSSKAVADMRAHDSYPRLIQYNKTAVFLALSIILFSVFMFLIIAPEDGIGCFSRKYTVIIFKVIVCFHAGLCIWSAIDTVIFVRIFYKIILAKSK